MFDCGKTHATSKTDLSQSQPVTLRYKAAVYIISYFGKVARLVKHIAVVFEQARSNEIACRPPVDAHELCS